MKEDDSERLDRELIELLNELRVALFAWFWYGLALLRATQD